MDFRNSKTNNKIDFSHWGTPLLRPPGQRLGAFPRFHDCEEVPRYCDGLKRTTEGVHGDYKYNR